jgi:hypothetical protein
LGAGGGSSFLAGLGDAEGGGGVGVSRSAGGVDGWCGVGGGGSGGGGMEGGGRSRSGGGGVSIAADECVRGGIEVLLQEVMQLGCGGVGEGSGGGGGTLAGDGGVAGGGGSRSREMQQGLRRPVLGQVRVRGHAFFFLLRLS